MYPTWRYFGRAPNLPSGKPIIIPPIIHSIEASAPWGSRRVRLQYGDMGFPLVFVGRSLASKKMKKNMRFGARWIYVIFECKFLSSWPQTWQFYGPVFSVAPCSSGCPYNSYNSAGVARAGWTGDHFWGDSRTPFAVANKGANFHTDTLLNIPKKIFQICKVELPTWQFFVFFGWNQGTNLWHTKGRSRYV